jgi:hypothetical protein
LLEVEACPAALAKALHIIANDSATANNPFIFPPTAIETLGSGRPGK